MTADPRTPTTPLDARQSNPGWRFRFIVGLVLVLSLIVSWRIISLQVLDNGFLKRQGEIRSLRTLAIPAFRGAIYDRNGAPLAVSTPMTTIWVNVKELLRQTPDPALLAQVTGLGKQELDAFIQHNQRKQFAYLFRRIPPDQASAIMLRVKAAHLKGFYTLDEFRRYYPEGATAAHVVGFTDINDTGSEGIELAFDPALKGVQGKRQVIKNLHGELIADLGMIKPAQPGHALTLSIDIRLQYLANKYLKEAMDKNKAEAASAVIMDVRTGEILAMANQPAYNPNNLLNLSPRALRNSAMIDVFEPASTMKTLSMTAALESHRWKPADTVNVRPGYLKLGKYTVHDLTRSEPAVLNMTDILIYSSNVGISQVAFDIGGDKIHDLASRLGFGKLSDSAFPGERAGVLPTYRTWYETETATLSYGYGLSVTAVQLVKAYAVLANGGHDLTVSLLKAEHPAIGRQVVSPEVAATIRSMLTNVIEAPRGIFRARIDGYHVAGKSGTSRKNNVYAGTGKRAYRSLFTGFAPASDPRFAIVVVVDNPTAAGYYGGLVAAPVFKALMTDTLRIYNVPPDNPATLQGSH
ncbi:peptidoglycan D,D-transpeptidase FtsI family protein [Pseudomonas putida]|uniref:peptidoglycan D,D-transpeptidase FtsI family protein n=1 Tax=Pseudomonas putida TaxID=303 RepID=UPI00383B3FD7